MPKVPYTKPALNYAAQLQQLKDRGLIIQNDSKALHILENLSYYRLSAYWYPMISSPKSAHIFKKNSTFENAFRLYCFDRELRKLISSELEKIEIAVRSKMIYNLSHKYGAFWYLDNTLFIDRTKLASSLYKLRNEYKRSDEKFIKSFNKKYSDPLPPSWMILEISSFGNLSYFYSNLNPGHDKREIANYFGLDDTTFESWLHSFTYVRNVCAHHSRLWNKEMSISPKVPITPSKNFITNTFLPNPISGNPPMLNNKKVYFLLSMIVYLLNTINPHNTFKRKLLILLNKYPMVDVRAMGFPKDWENESIWEWRKVINENKWYNRFIALLFQKNYNK